MKASRSGSSSQMTATSSLPTTSRMEEGVVSANYEMTIYDGGLNQSEIQAVFSHGGDTLGVQRRYRLPAISWSRASQTRALPPTRSMTSADTADSRSQMQAAVDNGNVTYYVNDSEVQVDPGLRASC